MVIVFILAWAMQDMRRTIKMQVEIARGDRIDEHFDIEENDEKEKKK